MKNLNRKFFPLLALVMCCGASLPNIAAAQQQVAAQNESASTLEIQISSSLKDNGKFLTFGQGSLYLSLIFRNVSAKPVQLLEEWNSWGFNNIHLEITAINGKTLPQPLVIKKAARQSWLENRLSTETLAPNQSMVREIRLHVPAIIRHPDTPPTEDEVREDNENLASMQRNEYWFFLFSTGYGTKTITMKAVYEVSQEKRRPDAWTGRIESPLLTYEVSRYTFGY
ncbi:hypothetical protein B1R32_10459 [Abditibacterium utsteinense]|uniref:Uncharacterized protein n=1 Tax=Abditibacterium utsteinense TaxID=1960156 RepID=A0A2S8SUV1_9BACT|nr:hypothetical protein [Abditibacterium utsteinense]PQV64566.1 hypothetical protein B1R32_10459 [Abditibacterium utsteinense]